MSLKTLILQRKKLSSAESLSNEYLYLSKFDDMGWNVFYSFNYFGICVYFSVMSAFFASLRDPESNSSALNLHY